MRPEGVRPGTSGLRRAAKEYALVIKLYHAPMTRSSRVLWLLEELDADYEIIPIEIQRRDGSGRRDPRNPHPFKQVPIVDIDGEVIMESLAVWLHLADMFPQAGLAPPHGAAVRTRYMGLMGMATAVFEPLVLAVMEGRAFTGREVAAREALDRELMRGLASQPHLLGENFSAADLVYFSLLRFFPAALPTRPEYQEWIERISSRPALVRMRAKDGASHVD